MNRLETLLQFHREDPGDPFTRFALGQEYRQRGDLEQALAAYESLAADEPDYLGTYYHLGKLYEDLGRKGDAIASYRRGIERATAARDTHSRSELQGALLEAQGIGFEDDDDS
jgi:tetratricopeptide (TPR) repeat protein